MRAMRYWHRFFSFIISALLIAVVTTATCYGGDVIFLERAEITDSVIRLGDIVKFSEENEFTRALASQLITQAPIPGNQVTLRSQAVRQSIVSSFSGAGKLRWSGPELVTVLRKGISIGPERIMDIIADFLRRQRGNLPEARITFLPSALPLPFILPAGELSCDVIPSDPGILGSSRISLIFKVDGRVEKNMSVRGRIEALAEVVVAGRGLRRGTVLQSQELTTSTMDIGELSNATVDLNDAVGMRLTRSVRSGAPILSTMLEELPIVHRGEKVKMIINSGPLHLTATGYAHTDGKLNDIIRVQNSSSQKTVMGRVTAPGIVEISL